MQRKMCEIDGKRYMSPSSAADLWNTSYQSVTKACKDGRIPKACKDSGGKWIIPVDAIAPLDSESIRKLLISTLAIKNGNISAPQSLNVDNIRLVYTYLSDIGCIEHLENITLRTPCEAVLTDKGFHIATEGKPLNLDWVNISTTFVQVVSSVITIWQAIH